jgi:hypothetical protein
MNRKIKALGLALVAALALTAVMASAASAQFTSDKDHTLLHGIQTTSHVFTAGSGFGGISCTTATFSGTGTGTHEAGPPTRYNSSTQVVNPTYSGCKDTFGRTVHVHNNLTYTFLSGASKGSVEVTGSMSLTVTSGGGAVICTVTIVTPQTNNGISYTNEGGKVKVTTNTSNVKSVTAGGSLNCGVANGEHTGGTYTGTTVMNGEGTDGSAASISVD